MATSPASSVKGQSSSIPLSGWLGLAILVIGLAIMWLMPEVRLLVGTLLLVGALLVGVLTVLRRRLTPEAPSEHDEAAPLHLRE